MKYFVGSFTAVVLVVTSFVTIFSQDETAVPAGAATLEVRSVTIDRDLILWMPHPSKHPDEYTKDDFYTCPDQTRGSYYSGEVHVSLVDSKTNQLINTIIVKGGSPDDANGDLDIPYKIRPGHYYVVGGGDKYSERKPTIMALKDYNGDGRAQEFALFDAEACMGLGTTLIGYSEKEDRVRQYPIVVTSSEGTTTEYWLDYLFSEKPLEPGYWKYQIDYRGRGGTLDKFTVSYDRALDQFEATIVSQP